MYTVGNHTRTTTNVFGHTTCQADHVNQILSTTRYCFADTIHFNEKESCVKKLIVCCTTLLLFIVLVQILVTVEQLHIPELLATAARSCSRLLFHVMLVWVDCMWVSYHTWPNALRDKL